METSYEKYVGVIFDGRYRIEKVIGLGGMAVVFKAVDLQTQRYVAIKLLREEMTQDVESVKRFINESKAVAMLSHPNIVKIFAVSVKEDLKYIVMEYIEGVTLKAYMKHKKVLEQGEILNAAGQILKALDHAHQKGIVHRDIKPQNIMLLKTGQIKVTDFGIAKLPNAETVTMTDKAIGTVYYISPEQASGQQIDARSDLYSLGATMYEMATGELPFDAESPVSVALMQVNEKPHPPRSIKPSISVGLEQIITTAMEKDPEERYQSAAEMLEDVRKLKEIPNATFKNRNKKTEKENFKTVIKKLFTGGSMLPITLGVTIPFILIFIICGIVLLSSIVKSTTTDTESITVPDFEGKLYTEELAEWFERSEEYNVDIKFKYDTEYEDGYIISQTPKAGSKKKIVPGVDKCEITLTVSGAAADKKVPNLKSFDKTSAVLQLKNRGIKYEIVEISDPAFDAGQVIKTDPAAGQSIASDAVLKLYVSTGPDTSGTVKVPDLADSTEKEALALILGEDLMIGNVSYERSDKPAGTVISQSIEKDTEVPAKTKIDLVISGGAKYDPNKGFNTEEETTKAPETTKTETTAPEQDDTTETTAPKETEDTTTDAGETKEAKPEENANV